MQVGSDGVQSCGTCHFSAGADNRTKNQLNPNHLSGDTFFEVGQAGPTLAGANHDLVASDFPLHKLNNPDIAGDPKCASPIQAHVNAGVLEHNPGGVDVTVCSAGNIVRTTNDVVSSMGVKFGRFKDIQLGFIPSAGGVNVVRMDLRSDAAIDNIDPIPGFAGNDGSGHQFRRVEPRNTPTLFAAAFNFDNFWDGRARHDFNGGSVFGAADPQGHVWVNAGGTLTPTRQIIRFSSLASLATGPGLSEFEMSFLGRNWPKIAKKLLQGTLTPSANSVTPLANQLVDPTDSILGSLSNQGGSECATLGRATAAGKPGLCTTYQEMIQRAFYNNLWNINNQHLIGCYTDGNAVLHPNQCGATHNPPITVAIRVLSANGTVQDSSTDPFDNYVLAIDPGALSVANTNEFTHMQGNFSLFWGLSVHLWSTVLVPDDTPFDKFLDQNPDAYANLGEPGEAGLVGPQPMCTRPNQRFCVTEVANFKRDANLDCTNQPAGGELGGTVTVPNCRGTRNPGDPDPLLGLDLFFASNVSLKNRNFRSARCGECHASPTLTDNTVPFTFKAQLRDFVSEFAPGAPGVEFPIEPLGRLRVISGFLLESEMNENGQDGVERRIINQSIVPNPTDGLAYPDGIFNPSGAYKNAGASYFDNGVYNVGVTPCEADQKQVTGRCDDIGRGGTDAFGWPLSLASLMLKNVGGPAFEPGVPLPNFNPSADPACAPNCATGGLFEESNQDQQINPGFETELLVAQLPSYLAPFANAINVGDAQPELDEIFSGLNTLTDTAMLEGFLDTLGPFNPAGKLNESLNNGDSPLMGTWPIVNRVGRMGSFKAPQLREVELTGPYFHNGGKLTLRQVVDFYARGGDFPMTNAEHRDFNIMNLNIEVQSNLNEAEKVALVDFLLELTDDRVAFERAPFDHPEVFAPLDGTAPENTFGRPGFLLRSTTALSGAPFRQVLASGAAGIATRLPGFLGVERGNRNSPNCDPGSGAISHYCH
jgi:cytochrome c peroxidase